MSELVSLVVPVRNEHEGIGRFLSDLEAGLAGVPHEILICYDADDDTTLTAIAALAPPPPGIRLVKNTIGPGPSCAMRAGLSAAVGDVIVVTMADSSDPPEAIIRMAELVRKGADIVSGSRYMRGGRQVGGPRLKGFLSRAAGLSLHYVAGLPTHDATTSFRAFSSRFVKEVSLESSTGFTLGLEATLKAHRLGYVVSEVPVTWTDRTAGTSNFRVGKWLPAYLRFYVAAMALPALLWMLALGSVALVYSALPRVFFGFDDVRHLVVIPNRGALYFLVEPFGGHMLFTRNAVFLIARAVFGFEPEGYGWLSLLTHLLNVALLFRLAHTLTKDAFLATFCAALWGMCPLQSGTLESHSVYGHALVATCLLVVLNDLASHGEPAEFISARRAVAWAFLLLIASTCFGVGIGVAVAAPVVVALLVDEWWRRRGLLIAFVVLPLAVCVGYAANRWLCFMFEPMEGLVAKAVDTPMQLFHKNPWDVLSVCAHLLGVGLTGLSGVYPLLGEQYPAPSTPGIVGVFGAALIVSFVAATWRTRKWIVAMFIVAASAYGIIALGRTNWGIALGWTPAEIAMQTRYHYVGTIALAVICTLAIGELACLSRFSRLPMLALVGLLAGAAWMHSKTAWAVDERAAARREVAVVLASIDAKIEKAPVGADVFIPWEPISREIVSWIGYEDVPGNAGLFVAAFPANTVRGHRAYFVEAPEHQGAFRDSKNHRLSTLFVSADAAKAASTSRGELR